MNTIDKMIEKVQKGTYSGLKDGNITVHKEWILGDMNVRNDSLNWWNCIYVAVCSH